jgi:hypothetical protein
MDTATVIPRYAVFGVRPGDLRAIAVRDRVLAQPGLAACGAPRARLFIVGLPDLMLGGTNGRLNHVS